jgi:Na+/H+-dicarboxylate symporter
MTKNYLQSALDMLTSLQAESTKTTISSLQLVTTIGVVSGLIAYLGKDTLPPFTKFGALYLAGLLILTWLINSTISYVFKRRMYTVKQHSNLKI